LDLPCLGANPARQADVFGDETSEVVGVARGQTGGTEPEEGRSERIAGALSPGDGRGRGATIEIDGDQLVTVGQVRIGAAREEHGRFARPHRESVVGAGGQEEDETRSATGSAAGRDDDADALGGVFASRVTSASSAALASLGQVQNVTMVRSRASPGSISIAWMIEPTGMLRIGSVLPALIGARTLALLRDGGPAIFERRVKVPRGEVRKMILASALASPRSLRASFENYRK